MSRSIARPVPAIDDDLRLEARGAVRLQLGGASVEVEPSRPDAHRSSIGGTGLRSRSCLPLRTGCLIFPRRNAGATGSR
jgi:hypothetical protein